MLVHVTVLTKLGLGTSISVKLQLIIAKQNKQSMFRQLQQLSPTSNNKFKLSQQYMTTVTGDETLSR